MNESESPRSGRNQSDQAVVLAADGDGKHVKLDPSHNWATVVASSTVSTDTGNVSAQAIRANPQGAGVAVGQLATLALTARGVAQTVHVPPGAQLRFELDNFSGTGTVLAVVTSWSEL